MQEQTVVIGRPERKTVAEAGERYVEHLANVKQRKRTRILSRARQARIVKVVPSPSAGLSSPLWPCRRGSRFRSWSLR